MQLMLGRLARRRSLRGPTLLLLAVCLAVGSIDTSIYSLAVFTSNVSLGTNAFTSGTIVIGTSPTSALISFTYMLPGDSVTAPLTVSNTGTGDLRYAMTSSSTNADGKALRDQLTLVVKTIDADTSGCTHFNGTELFSGALSAAAFGDPSLGAQAGDRTLVAAASELLCFRAALALSTGTAFKNAATTTTFTFSAEQTANNP